MNETIIVIMTLIIIGFIVLIWKYRSIYSKYKPIAEAKEGAEKIVREAEEKARHLIEEKECELDNAHAEVAKILEDAKKSANQIREDADRDAQTASSEAVDIKNKARIEAEKIVSEGKEKARRLIEEKECELDNAHAEVAKILEDAKKSANQIREDADRDAQTASSEAVDIKSKARIEAEKIVSDARLKADGIVWQNKINIRMAESEAEQIKAEARLKLSEAESLAVKKRQDAIESADEIIRNAESKAKEIVGEGYELAKNADLYKELAIAMKNQIEGYGDEYLKPASLLLDDLAQEFGYTEAGQMLQKSREASLQMIKDGDAATCDYVENNRRTTAINFIVDAFNGKVDSILSKIKKDNYGTLERKIKDAFYLVNHLGRPFRDARITYKYLEARLEELKWGVMVDELKRKEKEEQRIIKEQMREEERARREYERAMKEAAKEEETIRKAMEKAQAAMKEANEAQKKKYEEQLFELETRLREAEEKNQRAQSMAQQTKSGHVYIISNIGSFGENVFKIGMTRRLEPLDRVRELGDASVPFSFDVHAMIYSEDAPQLESELHRAFDKERVNKVNARKEFFNIPLTSIRQKIEELGLMTMWTMTAAAEEYKESKMMETKKQVAV